MSKKRSPSRKKKVRSPSVLRHTLGRRLITAALRLEAEASPDSWMEHPVFIQLGTLVQRALAARADQQLLAALLFLEEEEHVPALDMLEFCVKLATSVLAVKVMAPDRTGEAPGFLRLVVLPILLLVEPRRSIPTTVAVVAQESNRQISDILATSFRRYGLIGERPSVVLDPHLYALKELPPSWSARRDSLLHLARLVMGQAVPLQEPPRREVGENETWCLRFLVAGILAEESEPIPLFAAAEAEENEGDDDFLSIAPQLLSWQEDAAHSLFENLPGIRFAQVGLPASWEEAIAAGADMHNTAGLLNFLATLEPLDGVRVAMGWYASHDELQLRIGFARDGLFLGGFTWVGYREQEEELKSVLAVFRLKGYPLDQLQVSESVVVDSDTGDGASRFPRPDQNHAGIQPDRGSLH